MVKPVPPAARDVAEVADAIRAAQKTTEPRLARQQRPVAHVVTVNEEDVEEVQEGLAPAGEERPEDGRPSAARHTSSPSKTARVAFTAGGNAATTESKPRNVCPFRDVTQARPFWTWASARKPST